MTQYGFTRTPDGKFDVSHAEDCYDGRFSRQQLERYVVQLVAEGHSVVDMDNDCYAESPEEILP